MANGQGGLPVFLRISSHVKDSLTLHTPRAQGYTHEGQKLELAQTSAGI